MTAYGSSAQRGDGRLWAVALGLSLVVNAGLFIAVGLAAVRSEIYRKERPAIPKSAPTVGSVVTIFPQTASPARPVPVAPPEPEKTRFARTSPDQSSTRPKRPAFIGERDTEATSDRAPTDSNPALPSQKGENPKSADDLETTQSDYKDGKLGQVEATPSPATPPSPAPMLNASSPEAMASGEKTSKPGNDNTKAISPAREKLLQGPNPVDVAVPKETANTDELKPTPPKLPNEGSESKPSAEQPSAKPQQMPRDPAFSGYQRKAAITGSISRTGRSALAVVDSPLGRYQAIISRAVEQEWQRNCVRHRDFITPGFLTVRFFVETSGRVRTVQFVGEMETGEVQKGFTLNSIRDAEIPPMPPALKQEYAKEPLELIFNFYF